MKILIVTQEDPFYLPFFFETFFHLYQENNNVDLDIHGIIIQQPLGDKTLLDLVKRMYSFYDCFNFFRQSIRFIMIKAGNYFYKLGINLNHRSIQNIVLKHKCVIMNFSNVNSTEFISYVKNHKIELIVSVAASQIFRKDILNTPIHGCINIHNSPLPDYRGMLPNFWQMYHDEKFSTMTIHKMVEQLDKGDIIHQEKTRIENQMTLNDLIIKTKINSAKALWKVLKQFKNGNVSKKPLPDKKGSYFKFPTQKDVRQFNAKGKKII